MHPLSLAPHPLESCVRTVKDAFALVLDARPDGLEPDAQLRLLRDSQQVVAQAQAFAMRIASSVEKADIAKTRGASSTAELMAGIFGGDRHEANRMLHTAKTLEESASVTQEAMARGELGMA